MNLEYLKIFYKKKCEIRFKRDVLKDSKRFGGDVSGKSQKWLKLGVIVGLNLKIPKLTIF